MLMYRCSCRHQAAVAKHFKLVSVNIPPIDSRNEAPFCYHSKRRRKHKRKLDTDVTFLKCILTNHPHMDAIISDQHRSAWLQ